jgi:TolB protein
MIALAAPAEAAFPGQNGPIAFQRLLGGGQIEIFGINPDGSGVSNLTNNGDSNTAPAFSPDGSRIAFIRDLDVWVMNADGTGQVNLTNDPGNGQPADSDPSFSPDGQRIVYSRDTNMAGPDDEIFTIGVDGTGRTNLTNNGIDQDADPTFSPDGTKIAWVRDEHGPSLVDEIFTMNADGSNQTQLTQFGVNLSTTAPDYSPDGARIVFAHDGDIWKIDADGSDLDFVILTPAVAETDPVFSPDGHQVAMARDTGGASTVDEIFTYGNGLTNLTNSPQSESGPSWGPVHIPAVDTSAPETTLTKRPPKRSDRRRPRFAFTATEPATFECRLDKGKWKPCSSPRKPKRRLKPRRHRFRVRATDLAGNTDPTPARYRFRVLD